MSLEVTNNNVTKIEEILNEIKAVGNGKVSIEQMNELKEAISKRDAELDKQMGSMETQLEKKMAEMVDKIGGAFEKATYQKPDEPQRFKSFDEFLGKVKTKSLEIKDLAEGSGDSGGYLVPDSFSSEILQLALEQAIIRPRARKITLNAPVHKIPALSQYNNAAGSLYGGVTTYWGSENGELTESQPTFDRVKLEIKKLTGYVEDPNELEEDAIVNMSSLLTEMFGEAIAFEEDDTFINGDGINKPLGVLTAPCLVTVSRATTTAIIQTADVIGMLARFKGSIDRAVFMVNQSALPSIYKLKDENNNYIWHPGNSGTIANKAILTLYGIPMIVTEKCPAVGTTGDIILADWGHYIVADRYGAKGGLRIDWSQHYKFKNDQMAYRFIKRVDGQPWLKTAITPRRGGSTLSPFVAVT